MVQGQKETLSDSEQENKLLLHDPNIIARWQQTSYGIHVIHNLLFWLSYLAGKKENQWMKMSSTDARGDIMGTGDIKTADLISELEYVSKSIL